ncbi:hypothetical protein GIB67_021698 [Kingdonia uniflora]|uniref:Uncharacterized protein n=1 Tax=Kingdonia uniflora TaxID=39325 RepID=A0A7J7LMB8_9MAGN|nr:hypothetical protein GIB67_021698 [Kingdonia uniflora]
MDDSEVIGTVIVDKSVVPSRRDAGFQAEIKTGQFFMYPKNVDVAKKFLQYKRSLDGKWRNYVINAGLWFRILVRANGKIDHYQVPSLDKWKGNMGIGDDIYISYYNGTGAEDVEDGFLCYLNQVVYGLSIPLTFFQKGIMNHECSKELPWPIKRSKERKSGYMFSDSARPKFFDFESTGRPRCDHLVMVRGNCMQVPGELVLKLIYKNFNEKSNPNGATDMLNLFDVVSREGTELNKVLGVLGIRREKRLNFIVEKVKRAYHNRAMATSGSAYDDILEISACVAAPVQTPQVETEGVGADVNMVPPLKKQKQESGKDIRASPKGVNLKAVEQEALNLVKRDLIRLDTQIRSSISHLFVAWKSVAEVLKVAATDRAEYEVEKASLAEQLKEGTALYEQLHKEKVLQKEQFEKEKALQKDQFKKEVVASKKEVEDEAKKGLSREDVDLALAGKYNEIIFLGDGASSVAEQSSAPPLADDTTKEAAGANS